MLVTICRVLGIVKVIYTYSPNTRTSATYTFAVCTRVWSLPNPLNWSLARGFSYLLALLIFCNDTLTCQNWRWVFQWWSSKASYDASIFVTVVWMMVNKYSQIILNNFILKCNKLLLEMLWYQYNKNMLISPLQWIMWNNGKSVAFVFPSFLEVFRNNDYYLFTWLNMGISVIL